MEWREFVCLDCKAHVFSWNGAERERCYNCTFCRTLPPEQEAELRKVLDCELKEEDECRSSPT